MLIEQKKFDLNSENINCAVEGAENRIIETEKNW
jgi:hypothetical protein